MRELYLGYLDYARNTERTWPIRWPRLWAAREVLWDYCWTCFHHYYSYLTWRGKVPPRSTL